MAINQKLSEERIQEVIKLYSSGVSTLQLGSRFKVSHQSIRYHLLKRNVLIRCKSEARKRNSLDESVFDFINEENAYWIGLLMADGNVYLRPKASARIKLTLIKGDELHIEKFKQFCKTTSPIFYDKSTANLAFSSNKIASSLAEYGVTPKKSLTASVSNNLKFNRDFWRGVIDGDGTISDITKFPNSTPKHKILLGLVGSDNLVNQFSVFVEQSVGVKVRPQKRGNISTFSIKGVNALMLIKYLYSDCLVALPRKLERARKIIENEKLTNCECKKCGHKWIPNKNNPIPKRCSKCRLFNCVLISTIL